VYDAVGWQVAVLLLAAFSLLPLPLILGWQEGASTSGLPEPRATLRSALAFFSRSAVHWWCLALIPAYTLGFTMAYSLVRPILVDAGWDEGRIGLVVVIGGSGAGGQRLADGGVEGQLPGGRERAEGDPLGVVDAAGELDLKGDPAGHGHQHEQGQHRGGPAQPLGAAGAVGPAPAMRWAPMQKSRWFRTVSTLTARPSLLR